MGGYLQRETVKENAGGTKKLMDTPSDRTSAALLALLAQSVAHTHCGARLVAVAPSPVLQFTALAPADDALSAHPVRFSQVVRKTEFFYQEKGQ
jgi:hypothetical protein